MAHILSHRRIHYWKSSDRKDFGPLGDFAQAAGLDHFGPVFDTSFAPQHGGPTGREFLLYRFISQPASWPPASSAPGSFERTFPQQIIGTVLTLSNFFAVLGIAVLQYLMGWLIERYPAAGGLTRRKLTGMPSFFSPPEWLLF